MKDIKAIKLNETEKRFIWEVLNSVAQTNQKIIEECGDGFKHEQLKENSKTALKIAELFTPGLNTVTISIDG